MKSNINTFFRCSNSVIDPTENKSSQFPRSKPGRSLHSPLARETERGSWCLTFQTQLFICAGKNKETWMLSPASNNPLHLTALPWQKEYLWFLLHRSRGRKTCKLAVTSSARKWFTLHETAGKMKFTPNHHKALSLNQCVAETIVGDINPFSIFERQGLCNELECIEQNYHILSLKYISPVVLPKKGMRPG